VVRRHRGQRNPGWLWVVRRHRGQRDSRIPSVAQDFSPAGNRGTPEPEAPLPRQIKTPQPMPRRRPSPRTGAPRRPQPR
jgi:hypothetical protein